jgi:hypothetical protein
VEFLNPANGREVAPGGGEDNFLPLPESEPDPVIARQILSYFVRNPQAADGLEGIARWRLLEEQIHHSLQQTDAAVTWLVSRGYLQEIQPGSAVRLYRLDSNRQAEAVQFLAEQDLTGPGRSD